jgi:predicted RNA-binding Zn ribbon-like protein
MSYHDFPPRLIGGRLCLDFTNTANWHGHAVLDEKLATPENVVAWAHHAGLAVGRDAHKQGDVGAAVALLRVLRADLRRLFVGATTGAAPGRAAIVRLNDLLARRGGRLRLTASGGRVRHVAAPDLFDAVGLPVAVSAIDLLTSPDIGRVKMCPAGRCEWLFVDHSRNGTRRWCSMEDCGNRAKARLHYDRLRRRVLPARKAD